MKITIPKPCHENWAAMTPDEKGRFCKVCSKSVRDFTSASDLQIMNNLSGDINICGNFQVDQLDRNLSHSFINSLFTKFAVGFVLTSGGIVSAQTQPKKSCEVKTDVPIQIRGEVSQVPTPKTEPIKRDTLNNIKGKPLKLDIGNTQQIRVGGAVSSIDLEKSQPLYVVDGKISSDKKFRKIDPNSIEKLEVLKDAAATALYGARAQYGAIIITLKEETKNGKTKVR